MNLSPAFLLVPTDLENDALVLLRSAALPKENMSAGVFTLALRVIIVDDVCGICLAVALNLTGKHAVIARGSALCFVCAQCTTLACAQIVPNVPTVCSFVPDLCPKLSTKKHKKNGQKAISASDSVVLSTLQHGYSFFLVRLITGWSKVQVLVGPPAISATYITFLSCKWLFLCPNCAQGRFFSGSLGVKNDASCLSAAPLHSPLRKSKEYSIKSYRSIAKNFSAQGTVRGKLHRGRICARASFIWQQLNFFEFLNLCSLGVCLLAGGTAAGDAWEFFVHKNFCKINLSCFLCLWLGHNSCFLCPRLGHNWGTIFSLHILGMVLCYFAKAVPFFCFSKREENNV